MSKTPRIEIFRPGTFVSAEGTEVSFSASYLQQIANGYDPALFDAPLVVGHPKMNAPAYGWVSALAMDGDVLVADPKDVDASFAELVNARRYKKVSAQFYPPDHPENPTPGVHYLKHIGFLGAQAPAVKGLREVSFSEAQQAGCVTLDTIDQENKMTGITPEQEKDKLASFAEREKTLEERERAADERDAKAAAAAKAALHASNVSFAEAQVGAGLLLPAGKDLVIGIMDQLGSVDVVSFGEGDGKAELTPNAAFRKLFDQAAPMISFGEKAKASDKPTPLDADQLAKAAQSFMEKEHSAGRMITIAAAVRHVEKNGA
ncbi:hypothetical protein HY78_00450 [Rhizorhabdus wittichii DC-6]|nr:hypothetical protein HY78_00450 [Rhizorhabdus wittichii DC-6]